MHEENGLTDRLKMAIKNLNIVLNHPIPTGSAHTKFHPDLSRCFLNTSGKAKIGKDGWIDKIMTI